MLRRILARALIVGLNVLARLLDDMSPYEVASEDDDEDPREALPPIEYSPRAQQMLADAAAPPRRAPEAVAVSALTGSLAQRLAKARGM